MSKAIDEEKRRRRAEASKSKVVAEAIEIEIAGLRFSKVEKYYRTRDLYKLTIEQKRCLESLEKDAKRHGIFGFFLSTNVFDFPAEMLHDVEKCLGARVVTLRWREI